MRHGFDLLKLIRPNIQRLKPYRSARDDFQEGILLDANENSLGDAINSTYDLHRYPDPYQGELRMKLAKLKSHPKDGIFVGNGSDEAIDLLFRIFTEPKVDNIIICPPTYGMYKVSASIHDIEIREAALTPSFELDVNKIKEVTSPNSKLLFLCTPNNPTANVLAKEKIDEVITSFPGIVVIDEAYIDFSTQSSWIRELQNYPNLVVLQTLSKAYGMAGIRLGMAFSAPTTIEWFMRVKAPYNLSQNTQKLGLDALNNDELVKQKINTIIEERELLIDRLKSMKGIEHVWPSETNFVLVRCKGALEIYKALASKGIIVRYRGNDLHCDNCLRISVGTVHENQQLLNALNTILG